MSAYLPLARLYELLEEAGPPAGSSGTVSAPRLEAVRALLDERVAGSWDDLSRLLVDPAELVRRARPSGGTPDASDPRTHFYEDYRLGLATPAPPDPEPEDLQPVESSPDEIVAAAVGTPNTCLIQAEDGPERTAVLAEIVRRLAAEGRRALLLSPTPATAEALLEALRASPDVRVVRGEPSEDPDEPDTLGELRRLRRELLWLEQWPRDLAALDDLRGHAERLRAELAANEQRLVEEIEAAGHRIEDADRRAAEARLRLELADDERRRTADEAARAQESWQDLQGTADAAARDADERNRAADDAGARHDDLTRRVAGCEQELQAARDREAALGDELARATATLPEATRDTEQLAVTAADATAEGHASYYRLAAAESALAAQRRTMSWGQRLHVAPNPEADEARQILKARRREADEAAAAAQQAVHAHQQAESLRAGLHKFIVDAEHEMTALAAAQQRLGEQSAALSADRDTAHAEFRRLAHGAAEAVDHATQTATAARQAGQAAAEAESLAAAARTAEEEAAAEVEHADTEAAAARDRLASLEAELELHRTDRATRIADIKAELRSFTDAAERSRRHVHEICGADPADSPPDLLTGHRADAMARIEDLSAVLENADLVHATPLGFGQGPYARGAVFDTLIALAADRLPDADLLIGATRTHRWLLIADAHGTPPPFTETHPDHTPDSLPPTLQTTATDHHAHTTFSRCLTTAPSLCHILTTPLPPDDATHPVAPPPTPTPAANPDDETTPPPATPLQHPASQAPDATAAAPSTEPNTSPPPIADATRPLALPPTERAPDAPSTDDATPPLDPPSEAPADEPHPSPATSTPHATRASLAPTPSGTPSANDAPHGPEDATRPLGLVPGPTADEPPASPNTHTTDDTTAATAPDTPPPDDTTHGPEHATRPLGLVPGPTADEPPASPNTHTTDDTTAPSAPDTPSGHDATHGPEDATRPLGLTSEPAADESPARSEVGSGDGAVVARGVRAADVPLVDGAMGEGAERPMKLGAGEGVVRSDEDVRVAGAEGAGGEGVPEDGEGGRR
ncbi:hypothetical protein [Thermomonospora umbrina]|nr:hypothetical protein [Thermomonospora umbrina]